MCNGGLRPAGVRDPGLVPGSGSGAAGVSLTDPPETQGPVLASADRRWRPRQLAVFIINFCPQPWNRTWTHSRRNFLHVGWEDAKG